LGAYFHNAGSLLVLLGVSFTTSLVLDLPRDPLFAMNGTAEATVGLRATAGTTFFRNAHREHPCTPESTSTKFLPFAAPEIAAGFKAYTTTVSRQV
jgi:hypothetical protein